MRRRFVLLAFAALAGCATEETVEESSRTRCRARPLGDLSRPVELELIAQVGDELRDVAAGPVALTPLGGGRDGVRLSVRARNLDGCAVGLVTRVDGVRAGTLVELREDGEGGWGRPAIDDAFGFVEVPLAPGSEHVVRVLIEDREGRRHARTAQVRTE